jgi:hypothetical protein
MVVQCISSIKLTDFYSEINLGKGIINTDLLGITLGSLITTLDSDKCFWTCLSPYLTVTKMTKTFISGSQARNVIKLNTYMCVRIYWTVPFFPVANK